MYHVRTERSALFTWEIDLSTVGVEPPIQTLHAHAAVVDGLPVWRLHGTGGGRF